MTAPFAWFRYQQGDRIYFDSKKWDDCQPLYTHPKKWVGLTIEEIESLGEIYAEKDRKIQMWGLFAVAVEEKLKEKNQ